MTAAQRELAIAASASAGLLCGCVLARWLCCVRGERRHQEYKRKREGHACNRQFAW